MLDFRAKENKLRIALSVLVTLCFSGLHARAQGSAEIALDTYGSKSSNQPVQISNGFSVRFTDLLAGIGLLSGSFNAAESPSSIRRGETFFRLSNVRSPLGLATVAVGDIDLSLNQVFAGEVHSYYMPALLLSGASASFSRRGSDVHLFTGSEYVLSGPQIAQRIGTRNRVTGGTSSYRLSRSLVIGSRVLIVNNAQASSSSWQTSSISAAVQDAITVSSQVAWNPFTPIYVYGEVGNSWSKFRSKQGDLNKHVSLTAGGFWRSSRLSVAATYLSQAVDYLPLAGAYMTSRSGTQGEFHVRLKNNLFLFGSFSDLNSLIALRPRAYEQSDVGSIGFNTSFGKTTVSGNLNVLHAGSSVIGQATEIRGNQLLNVAVARQAGKHNFRVSYEDLDVRTSASNMRQYVSEFEDGYHLRYLSFGGSLRAEHDLSMGAKDQIATRFFWNYSWRAISSYGSFEYGQDLANKSFLTQTANRSTVFGLAAHLRSGWEIRADAYRSNLSVGLNAANIELLSQNGYAPFSVIRNSQWTTNLRCSHSTSWGGGASLAQVAELAQRSLKEMGIVEGRVTATHGGTSNSSAAGIPVQLDRSRFSLTDHEGVFRFSNVPEGKHIVGIDSWHLPVEYEAVQSSELEISVQAARKAAATFRLNHLGVIRGQIVDLPASSPVVIELDRGKQITTPENDGTFFFDNILEGIHEIRIRPESMPADYIQVGAQSIEINMECHSPITVQFTMKYAPKEKPVRTIHLDTPKH